MDYGAAAETRFIGENAARNTVAHRLRHSKSRHRSDGEGLPDDQFHTGHKIADIGDDHGEASEDEHRRKYRNELLGYRAYAAKPARSGGEHHGGKHGGANIFRHTEGFKPAGYGIRLGHVAHAERSADEQHGVYGGEAFHPKPPIDIQHRPAEPRAVGGSDPVANAEDILAAAGHHAEHGGYPHPKYRPCAARIYRGRNADYVARAEAGGERRKKRPPLAHRAVAVLGGCGL